MHRKLHTLKPKFISYTYAMRYISSDSYSSHLYWLSYIKLAYTLCCKPVKGWGFEVGGYHDSLMFTNAMSFPWKIIWRLKVPLREALLF